MEYNGVLVKDYTSIEREGAIHNCTGQTTSRTNLKE